MLTATASRPSVVVERRLRRTTFSVARRADESVTKPAVPAVEVPAVPDVPAAAVETEHAKVFRLVAEGRYEEAARLAARLINSDNDDGLFIYGTGVAARRASAWFDDAVASTKRAASTFIQSLTPEMAQVLLLHNERNRRVDAQNLCDLMRDIADDRWALNGETIIVSRDGLVNDGQHRCFATLLTGTPIKTALAFGVTSESVDTVDIGKKRTGADRLKLRGVVDPVLAASTGSVMFEIDNNRKSTPSEVDRYVLEHHEEIAAGMSARGSTNIRGLGPTVAAASAVILLRRGARPDDIKEFFRTIRLNEGTKVGNPARTIHYALYPKDRAVQALRQKKVAWVSTLVRHFSLWMNGKKVNEPIVGLPIPEEI